MSTAGKNHYNALGSARTASHAELRRAYVDLARKYHPDFHIDDPPASRERSAAMMRRINDAWATLGDTDARAAYDRSLGRPVDSNGAPHPPPVVDVREPSSGHAPARWMQMAPALLLAAAFVLFAVGFVTNLVGLLAAGVGCALIGGVAFVLVPMVTAMRSRQERPRHV